MARFTQAVHSVLMATLIAGVSGCGEKETAPTPPPPPPAAPLTVGGSVTGLAGAMVLQLNGGEELTVNTDKFKFPKALAKGGAYAVTIKAQPSQPVRQTCTVSQGNGTIGATPVNNVAVSCTTNSYAVGGTVKGLSGKGLVLELKGMKEVEIAKNGDFVFPDTRLPDGSDYRVAIKATPAKQKCEIEAVNTARDRDTINIVAVTCSKKGRK